MKVMFDTVGYKQKPTNFDVATMQDRMKVFDIGVKDIKDKLVNGYTIRPSIIKGNKESEWKSQQVFMVDIDEGITTDEAIDKYEYLNPSFVYTSFSHTDENNKFRMAFTTEDAITDFDIAKSIQEYLINEIEESDKRCKNLNRLYYGGRDIVYSNTDNRINLDSIKVHYKVFNNIILKDIVHPNKTELRELQLEEYYKTIRCFDMHVLINKTESIFKCVLPDHEDSNPSAGIILSTSANNYGEYVYNCFGCGRTLDNIQLMERVLGKNRYETLKWFEKLLNIKRPDNDWVKLQKEKIDTNIEYIMSGDFEKDYPDLHSFIKRDIPNLISLYEFSKISCYNKDYITKDDEHIFYASLNKLKKDVFHCGSKHTATRTIQLFSLLNLVNKLDPKELPDVVYEIAKQNKQHNKFTNHFSVTNFSDSHLENVTKTAITLKSSNFTKKGMSREYLQRTFDKETADKIYPQTKHHKNTEISEKSTLDIVSSIFKCIEDKSFCREIDIKDSLLGVYSQEFIKTQLRRSVSEICESYDLAYLKATKDNKLKHGISESIHHNTKVFVKNLD